MRLFHTKNNSTVSSRTILQINSKLIDLFFLKNSLYPRLVQNKLFNLMQPLNSRDYDIFLRKKVYDVGEDVYSLY